MTSLNDSIKAYHVCDNGILERIYIDEKEIYMYGHGCKAIA